MIQLDLKSGIPICDQIVNGFIKLTATGIIFADWQMPSVRALATQLSVNPNTIQKAYGILESKGIIYSVKGKGSFVSGDKSAEVAIMSKAKADFSDAVEKAASLGMQKEDMLKLIEEFFS